MGAVRFCTANLLRRRTAGLVAITALIAIAGAVTLAAFAGARRTDTAYPRLLNRVHALDVLVAPDFGETVSARDLAKIPVVRFAADAYGFGLADWSGRGTLPPDANFGLGGFGLELAGARSGAESPRVSEGRLPRNERPGEIFANEAAAKALGLHVGSRVHYTLYQFSDLVLEDGSINPDTVFTPVTFTVVGIGTTVDDLLLNENQDAQSLLVSPAFVREYRSRASYKVAGVFLKLGSRDLPAFTASVNRILGDQKVQLQTRVNRERAFEAVADPYSASLLLFGVAATLAAFIVVAASVGAACGPRRDRRVGAGCARGGADDPRQRSHQGARSSRSRLVPASRLSARSRCHLSSRSVARGKRSRIPVCTSTHWSSEVGSSRSSSCSRFPRCGVPGACRVGARSTKSQMRSGRSALRIGWPLAVRRPAWSRACGSPSETVTGAESPS